jgi:hypothetical protein
MATPNLNLQEIELTDKLNTEFLNKLNNNMQTLDERYGQLAEGLLERTNQSSIEEALNSLEGLYDVSNATATAEDIVNGKTAYINGGLTIGTLKPRQQINVTLTGNSTYMGYVSGYGAGIDQNGNLVIWATSNTTNYEHFNFVNTSIGAGKIGVGWNITTAYDTADPAEVPHACTITGLADYSTINIELNVSGVDSTDDYITIKVTLTAE